MEKYQIRLDAFEGPMDLLLHLIQVNKIDIYDIPIALLTEQYLDYLAKMREFNIEVASEFLVMAATLLLIKSRSMLPKPMKESEGIDEDEDPAEVLKRQLLEYQRFKKVSQAFFALAEEQERYVGREPTELPVKRNAPEGLSVSMLWDAFRAALAVKRELTIPEAIVAHEEYRVEDRMEVILARLMEREDGEMAFESLFMQGTRDEIVATFLALLELIRRKLVVVWQGGLFSSIRISLRETEDEADMVSDGEG